MSEDTLQDYDRVFNSLSRHYKTLASDVSEMWRMHRLHSLVFHLRVLGNRFTIKLSVGAI